ncbi:hypothetical protein K440DRAFT_625430 [Wilcoxina mikolae CBS 423.85]|nr:hypothetical protein K440DRAFT_625430 [Wilcoxina mikolae CBS 423.85]
MVWVSEKQLVFPAFRSCSCVAFASLHVSLQSEEVRRVSEAKNEKSSTRSDLLYSKAALWCSRRHFTCSVQQLINF